MLITEIKIVEGSTLVKFWKKPMIIVNGKYLVPLELLHAVTMHFGKEVSGNDKKDTYGYTWIDDYFMPSGTTAVKR